MNDKELLKMLLEALGILIEREVILDAMTDE